MENLQVLVRQVLASAWRKRWMLVATAWAVCLVGWASVSTLPDTYESHARIYVDADAILNPLLRGLAIDSAMANQLDMMQRTLLSRPNLDKLINMTDLNISAIEPQQREKLIERLGREIKVSSEGRNLFTVTYRNANPQLARDVRAGVVTIFMEQPNGSNRRDRGDGQEVRNEQSTSRALHLQTA